MVVALLPTEHWVELNPCHIGLGNVGFVAVCTRGRGHFRSRCCIRLRVMAEGKETPPIRFCEALAVLYRFVDAVEFPVEEATSGRLGTGSIAKLVSEVFLNKVKFSECL
jgi:hypothetical protein